MLTQIFLGVITCLLGITAYFIQRYIKTTDEKIDNSYHRTDVIRKEHDDDIRNISQTLAMCSSQVDKLAGTVQSFVRSTERNMDRYDKEIKVLFTHKDRLSKEIDDIRIKAQIEARDSETSEFRKAFCGIDCLLLEDEDTVRDTMAEIVRDKFGFNVMPVGTIAEAFDAMEQRDYDVAIVDYCLRGEKATDFIKQCKRDGKLIKQNNGSAPVPKMVVYTGKEDAKLPPGTLSLEKPVNWEDMRKLMECILTE